jgi:hypothetical protein
MYAKETKADWTKAVGSAEYFVYRHPGEALITQIVSETFSWDMYIDTGHEVDFLSQAGDELVNQFECVGDTKGKEAGIRTGVRVHFNPITIEIDPGDTNNVTLSEIDPTPMFIPSRVGGDREFEGHGPRVWVSARLSVRNSDELWVRVWMRAKETKADWTEAEGSANYLIHKHDRPIYGILSATYSQDYYLDTDHAVDLLTQAPGELVRQFECVGDTKGKEAGIRTGVRVHFNPIVFKEV